jgi:protein-L-isoaspartate(D-aspartate) O-methyltransferase
MALQLEAFDVREGDSILEIGAGTGYNAALLSALVGQQGTVTSIDINADLIQAAQHHIVQAGCDTAHLHLLQGDGALGYAANAPYNRIIATCGVSFLPQAWIDQLKPHGLLLCNLLTNLASIFLSVEKKESKAGEGLSPFLEGELLDIAAIYMAMHTGTLSKKDTVDWSCYDALPYTIVHLSESIASLLQNPAYGLLLQEIIPDMSKRYRSIKEEIVLCLLTQESVIQIQDDHLTIYGNGTERDRIKEQMQHSIDLYTHLGRPRITDYHIRVLGHQLIVEIADQSWHLSL